MPDESTNNAEATEAPQLDEFCDVGVLTAERCPVEFQMVLAAWRVNVDGTTVDVTHRIFIELEYLVAEVLW